MQRCSRCKAASYCCKQCQKAGWESEHKGECKAAKFVRDMVYFNWDDFEGYKEFPLPAAP